MARFSLIPREEKFFNDFVAISDQIRHGARLLERLVSSDPPQLEIVDEIKEIEHKCDFLTHEIIQRLNRTFVTPLDREDIHSLASSLDDVMDAIDASAALFRVYRISRVRAGVPELAKMLVDASDEIRTAMLALENREGAMASTIRLNDIEHEADQWHQRAVGELFEEEKDPVMIMKWKEILDMLEEATDCCEDVANTVENILVKHG